MPHKASAFGPSELGRGIVVTPDAEVPDEFSSSATYRIDERALAQPRHLIEALHEHWFKRERVVIELAVDKAQLMTPEGLEVKPYELEPDFEFSQERLHFLTWANNYDATTGEPIWWFARLAQRLGAKEHSEAEVDLDGPVWTDGGPRTCLPFAVLHRESIKLGRLTLTRPSAPTPAELAPDQLSAVSHTGVGARILAPAGSGKTRVLTHRFAHLGQRNIEPELLTALAYNKRAAREMQERLGGSKHSVRTLHSLGYAILREAYGVQVASHNQVRGILRSLLRVPPQLNTDPYQPYLEAFQSVRLGLREPKEVEAERDDIPGFAEVFPRYRNRLSQQNLVDHDEQIYGAIELLLQNPGYRKNAQLSCTHLLVDEFQDLTPAFLLFIRLLSAPAYQVFGVGDDDQVIYGYAGATPEYLVNYKEYFPGSDSYQLQTNYRCPQAVAKAASGLLQHNTLRVDKNVRVSSKSKARPRLVLEQQELWTERAVEQVQSWLKDREPQDIAILSRVNALLLPVQIALSRLDIPHNKVVDTSILNRTGVRTALAYWRLCSDPGNMSGEDLADALRRPNRKLKREYIEGACRCSDRTSLKRYAMKLDEWPATQFDEFMLDLTFLGRRLQKGLPSFFQALRKETEFLGALQQLDASGLGAAGSSHGDDLLALEQLAYLCEEDDFEAWLREWLERPSTADGVRLSSVHRVKGLEWPCVMIFGVESGLFPHRLAEDEEEERRILHVALTRTQEECALIASPKSASPFLAEMGQVP